MLLALLQCRLPSNEARHAFEAWPRAEGNVLWVAHARHRDEKQADAPLIVARVDDHSPQCEALGLVDRERPRQHQRKLVPLVQNAVLVDLGRAPVDGDEHLGGVHAVVSLAVGGPL